MWKILCPVFSGHFFYEISSTYVENTFDWVSNRCCSRDQLHVCGEYHFRWRNMIRIIRSAPRMWRILRDLSVVRFNDEISSTYVENTLLNRVLPPKYQDQLHVCGEYIVRRSHFNLLTRSAPRMWRIH